MDHRNFFAKYFGGFGNGLLNFDEHFEDQSDDFENQQEKNSQEDISKCFHEDFSSAILSQSNWMNEIFNGMVTAAFGNFDPFRLHRNSSQEINPRDYMLKDAEEDYAYMNPYVSSEKQNSSIDKDSDIDDKVAKDGLFPFGGHHPQPPTSNIIFKQSVSRIILHPNGTVEEYRTYTDSNGQDVSEFTRSQANGERTLEEGFNEDSFFSFDKDFFSNFSLKFEPFEDQFGKNPDMYTPKEDVNEKVSDFFSNFSLKFEPFSQFGKNPSMYTPKDDVNEKVSGDPKYLTLFKKFFNLHPNDGNK